VQQKKNEHMQATDLIYQIAVDTKNTCACM